MQRYPDSVKKQPQQPQSKKMCAHVARGNKWLWHGLKHQHNIWKHSPPACLFIRQMAAEPWAHRPLKRFKAKRIKCYITVVFHYVTFPKSLCSPTLRFSAQLTEIQSTGCLPVHSGPSRGRNASPRAGWGQPGHPQASRSKRS